MDIFIQEVISRHFAADVDLPLLLSLENVDEDGNITKADMFSKQTIRPYIPIESADNAVED